MSENEEIKDPEQEAGIKEEAAAAEEVEAEVEAKEASKPKAHTPVPKKGLMERRQSFAQTSVPNAHKGYNPKTPVVMLGIIVIFFVASFILASISS